MIEFAIVLDDLNKPKVPVKDLPALHLYFMYDAVIGEPYALAMHQKLLEKMAKTKGERWEKDRSIDTGWIKPQLFGTVLFDWLKTKNSDDGKLNVAGKNFSNFDRQFMLKMENMSWWNNLQHHRVIDPSILFYNPGDKFIPGGQQCMERAGLNGVVAHTALEDAQMVVELVRRGLKVA